MFNQKVLYDHANDVDSNHLGSLSFNPGSETWEQKHVGEVPLKGNYVQFFFNCLNFVHWGMFNKGFPGHNAVILQKSHDVFNYSKLEVFSELLSKDASCAAFPGRLVIREGVHFELGNLWI